MSIRNYVKRLYGNYCISKRFLRYQNKRIDKIAIIYFIPKTDIEKYNNWEDGFTQAIKLLGNDYKITWINLEDYKPEVEELNTFDFLIVKSCWNWIVDTYIRSIKGLNVPRGIAISCSKMPHQSISMFFYDVLWYETQWYGSKLKDHPRTFQAFGINSKKFYQQNLDKSIDVLSIGALRKYKRHHFLLNEIGIKRVVIGNTNTAESTVLKKELSKKGILVMDFKTQEELSKIINQSNLVYIPCEINGGGERAVLEARACNIKVKVEEDNPKLIELLSSKIWTEKDYYKGLREGINAVKKLL